MIHRSCLVMVVSTIPRCRVAHAVPRAHVVGFTQNFAFVNCVLRAFWLAVWHRLRSASGRRRGSSGARAPLDAVQRVGFWEDRWLSSMGWEDYGSEGFSHPPPELFGFNQVRDAVFGDAEYYYACCGGEGSDGSGQRQQRRRRGGPQPLGLLLRRATPACSFPEFIAIRILESALACVPRLYSLLDDRDN